jgi:hypothetical protein
MLHCDLSMLRYIQIFITKCYLCNCPAFPDRTATHFMFILCTYSPTESGTVKRCYVTINGAM